MSAFSESEIEAAKRRVQEMRNKANKYAPSEPNGAAIPEQTLPKNSGENAEKQEASAEKGEVGEENSFALIMTLILILSKENADSKLILALLYLLL